MGGFIRLLLDDERWKGHRLAARGTAFSHQTAIEASLWDKWAKAPSAKWEFFARHPKGYWLADIRRLCSGASKDWTPLQPSCLHNTICGSQCPQTFFLAGSSDVRSRTACSGMHRGTVEHKTWNCKTLDAYMEQSISACLVKEARQALVAGPHDSFWVRGLMAKSALLELPPLGGHNALF